MKWIAPDYYNDFACLMGACRHSCCIGWEIDIDEESLQNYRGVPGAFGKRLTDNIVQGEDGAYFRLGAEERCPFLNADGLCDMILELGDGALCQICADHPRFRNFFSDREEIGLGLCCEAVGRLILGKEEKVQFAVLDDDGMDEVQYEDEAELLELRERLIEIAQDRSRTVDARLQCMLEEAGLPAMDMRIAGRVGFLLELERLDDAWADLLQKLEADPSPAPLDAKAQETALEQLLVYLLMRHLPGVLEDDELAGRIAFVCFIWQLVRDLFAACAAGLEGMVEIARMCSSEIEYSDENIGRILAYLHDCFPEL